MTFFRPPDTTEHDPVNPSMPKVLLVDDEPSIRLTMGEFLKRAGYSVTTAADYESGASQSNDGIDVAVIDINLPGKSGIQLLQKLCASEFAHG